jgi:hypothetical protein
MASMRFGHQRATEGLFVNRLHKWSSMADKFKLQRLKEVLNFPSPQWRIHGLLPTGGFSMLFAPQEQGKTFFALDIALSVASGLDFHGRRVKQGPVVYVLGEGRGGLKKRVMAWLREHRLNDVPDAFFVLEAVQFHSSEDVATLRNQIEATGEKPAMVVIDTFARCAVGIEENDATEMGQWIDAIRQLQEDIHVDILALHHATKSKGRKRPSERGSSAFIGATDTAIRLTRKDDLISVSCEKQKDAEHFDSFALHLKVVPLGTNENGEQMDSCVLVGSDDNPPCDDLTRDHVVLLATLAEFPNQTAQRGAWREKTELAERTFDRRREELLEQNYIAEGSRRGTYAITPKGTLAIANQSPTTSQGEAA